ncbi:MAG TPA: nitrile hydratase accessory protein [Geminicoccaceae bacterium]
MSDAERAPRPAARPPVDRAPGPLARMDDRPAFDEPWQAEALAIAVCLTERGVVTPGQWSEALGAALRDAGTAGEPDTAEAYYLAVLRALERVTDGDGLIGADALERRTEAWRQAYLRTPHGQPVKLSAAGDVER